MTRISSRRRTPIVLAAAPGLVLALGLAGCATKTYVRDEVGRSERSTAARLGEVQSEVERNRESIVTLGEINARHETRLAEISQTAAEALQRAREAGKLAEGKFLYEVTLTDESVTFPFESAELAGEATTALDRFAKDIVSRNENVYVEIQGHTDSSGPEAYNMALGLRRAEAVRRYLHEKHGFPLHRMSVISYGEQRPVADNDTREGRSENRRVTLVVLT